MSIMEPTEDWPYLADSTTYIIGHPETLGLFKGVKKRKLFKQDLVALDRFKVRRNLKFVYDTNIPEEYVYVCDKLGLQLIIEVTWKKPVRDIDISKFDA